MRIVLETIGKNHSFELARQLHQHQALVAIFTGYPKFKLKNEQLPPVVIRSFPWIQTLYMARGRIGLDNEWISRGLAWWSNYTLDAYVASHLPQGDVFMALSNTGLNAGIKAKQKGMVYVCDRGCSHIRYQDTILREEHQIQGIPFSGIDPRIINREEAEYAAADAITVPSSFSKRSFIEMGVPEKKIYTVPYGVELARFHPTGEPDPHRFDVLFVGGASLRKGIPYLLEGIARLKHPNKHLHIVGVISRDIQPIIKKYSNEISVVSAGHCPQTRLKDIMSRSHVLALPSVEDGFGLVMAEAMACGCPVIATMNTGAVDLYEDGVEGFIVPIRDSGALTARMQELADSPERRQAMSKACLRRVALLGGWDTYGDGMMTLFRRLKTPTDGAKSANLIST